MMGKLFGILIIVLALVLGGVFIKAFQKSNKYQNSRTPQPLTSQTAYTTTTPSLSPNISSSPSVLPPQEPIVKTRLVSIDVDNDAAGMTIVHVPKGWRIKIELHAMNANVDAQGLRFRSGTIDSGAILPGMSKSIDFIADQSFTLTPYEMSTGTVRPYVIQIVVE